MSFQASALILSWVAILLLAFVVSGLVRQVHALSVGTAGRPRQVGPAPGSPAPGFDRLAPEHPATMVLLFLDEDCRTCIEVLDEAARAAGAAPDAGVVLRALYLDDVPHRASKAPITVLGGQSELFERYDAIVRPFAVVVDPTGRVTRSEPLGSRGALRTLLAQVAAPTSGAPVTADRSSPGGTP